MLLQIIFAISHEKEPLAELEALDGRVVSLSTSAAGGVSWEEASDADLTPEEEQTAPRLHMDIPEWCGKWVVSMGEFAEGVVGAKSRNLAGVATAPSKPSQQSQQHLPAAASRQN